MDFQMAQTLLAAHGLVLTGVSDQNGCCVREVGGGLVAHLVFGTLPALTVANDSYSRLVFDETLAAALEEDGFAVQLPVRERVPAMVLA